MKKESFKLADGAELSNDTTIFHPEGQWVIRRGGLVWSKVRGWRKYHEVEPSEIRFLTAAEAMKAWQTSLH
ncbi:MAG: hypothetical protein WB780_21175 [Candidatus Acidiferrales bacterium]